MPLCTTCIHMLLFEWCLWYIVVVLGSWDIIGGQFEDKFRILISKITIEPQTATMYHMHTCVAFDCLFTQWKWTYILGFGPWRWSALNMWFVDKWPSRMQGQQFFQSRTGGHKFWLGLENMDLSLGAYPWPNLPPQKSSCGGGTSPKNYR